MNEEEKPQAVMAVSPYHAPHSFHRPLENEEDVQFWIALHNIK
jgi:hypothetical protein